MRKVFLDELPKKQGIGVNKGKLIIEWLKSVGYKVRFIYDDIEGWVEIVDYNKGNLYIKYDNKEPFKISTCSFKLCQLGGLLEEIINDFKIEIGTIFKDSKRDITIVDKEVRPKKRKDGCIQRHKYYKYICNKCGYNEGWIDEYNIINKNQGCSCCCNQPQTVVEHINSIVVTAPWMIKYFQGGYDEAKLYTRSSGLKITPICPDCGRVKDKEIIIGVIYADKSIGCNCGDGFSYGHKYVYSLLTQLNLDFEENKRYSWCVFPSYKDKSKTSKGEYDFVIENMKLIIEVDGGWHRKDNKISGQTKEHSKYLDDMKDLKAHKNGYRVVRISDEDSIKDNILKSELVDILNLNNIDWLKIEEFALSNLCKKICDIKKDNENISTTEICNIMKMNKMTIIKYLKKGTELGWCHYDPKEEIIKGNNKSSKRNKERCNKSIKMFDKYGNLLGLFESGSELERRSQELFGFKLHAAAISKVCQGKQPKHKGFTFKFV